MTPIFGRERELALATRLISSNGARLLTLTGPGGVGKTRLAIAVREELAERYSDGAHVVELAAVPDAALVPGAIAQALDVIMRPGEPAIVPLLSHLRDSDVLLVIDNVEHVIDAVDTLSTLLASCPGLTILATSRTPLRIRGEQELPVAPLALPGDKDAVDALTANPAVALFAQRARAVLPDFVLSTESATVIAEIVSRLDGLPLAIELAAARTRILPLEALRSRLEQRLPLLTGGARDMPERHRTVRATISWSHDLLDEDARTLFRRLAVFSGGFSIEAAEAVATVSDPTSGRDGDTGASVFDGLAILLDHALITRASPAGDARFAMLETVREYALLELSEHGEAESIRAAHAVFFLSLAEQAEPELEGPAQERWSERLALEHNNLRSALQYFVDVRLAEEALRLSSALWPFWSRRGYLQEGRAWLEQTLAMGSDIAPERRVKAALRLGNLALDLADLSRAEAMYQAGLAAQQELADEAGIAWSRSALGLVALHRGDHARAVSLFEDARHWCDSAGDARSRARVRHNLGRTALAAGDVGRARSLLEEAATIRRDLGDANSLAYTTLYLAEAALVEDRIAIAEQLLLEMFAQFQAQEDAIGSAWATHDLGTVSVRRGELVSAEKRYRQALATRLKHSDRQGIAESVECIGGIAVVSGRSELGLRLLASAEAWRQATGMARTVAEQQAFDRALAVVGADDVLDTVVSVGLLLELEQAAEHVLADPAIVAPDEAVVGVSDFDLTPRERDVLRLLAEGRSDREIADSLFMASRTVSWHVGHILAKLDVDSRTAAASVALRTGLVR